MTAGAGNDDILHFEGMLNIPVTEDLAMRLAFQHRESEGFVENTGTGQDWNDENAQNLRFSALWAPNDKFDALFIADVQRVREKSGLGSCEWAQPDNGALATSLLPSVAFIFGVYDEIRDTCNATQPYKSSENDPADSDVDGWGVSLNMTIDLNFAELTSITSYREIEDFNGSWGFASDTVGSASFLEVLGVRDNRGDQWSQELRLAGSAFEDRLEWVVGAHVFEENAANYLEVPLFRGVEAPDCAVWPVFCLPSGIPGFSTLGDFALAIQFGGSSVRTIEAKNASWAVFGEGTFALTEDLSLTLGARFSEDDREFVRTEILSAGIPDPRLICPDGGLPEGGTTCEVSKKFNELTPRAILSYKINEDVMIYGGWSEGYSSGGFNQDVRMRAYKPESSGNWEAGLKSTWLDRRLLLNLTGFYNTYKEQQLTVSRLVDGNPTADLINAQETVLYGLEGEASLLFGDGWSVQASFGWLDGEYEEFTVADNITGPPPDFEESILIRDLSGMEAIDGAPYTYSISVERIAVFGNGGSYFANLGWSFRGRTYGTIETLPTSRQGKYGLMDARFTYNFPGGSTSLSLWGSNLLDREYFSSAHDFSSGPSPTGTVSKHWGEPRRFGLDLSYRMGQ
ncbi:MAG: TonB-dependent receptor [Pseudomonadales bacterium]|nr:TonB-dependent receptor [Pseudomonadales bacterium]